MELEKTIMTEEENHTIRMLRSNLQEAYDRCERLSELLIKEMELNFELQINLKKKDNNQ